METPYIAMLKFWFLASLFLIEANNSLKNNRFHFKCNNDCSRYNCRKAKDVRDDCPGGIVYGVCGCCLYCARLEGQECGAYKNAKGVCDVGLYCDVGRIRRKKLHKYASGRCKKIPKQKERLYKPFSLILENRIPNCRPECTPEFCSMWPDAICSASKNHEKHRPCQAPCQHTTCQACYFEQKDEPPCRKCAKNDFDCLRRFGRCVKREICTRAKYPCLSKARRQVDGKFKCKVPACER
ncbi:cysteine-rich motor neuron 1 protein-like [Rhopilema esculentum]|uniref:cysteine-rich motor neuron 1 protein-like n=1 Tax=Rhopilema esculentum TaxID=499914 RepID=UPI0031D530DF